MPFGMKGCVQSVVVQGRVYVGGGFAGSGSDDNYTVMEYDISSGKWAKLPPYRACYFAMTVINNQLVLVGGGEHTGNHSKVLGVWRAESKEWTHPYPDMPTARAQGSAAVYNEWLVVTGGVGYGVGRLSSVEVMNTDSKQWYAAPPTPTPWSFMETAIVGDTCYFMGGLTGGSYGTAANDVYSVSLPALISQLRSLDSSKQHQIWKEIPGLRTICSTPLSIRGSLLAVGGRDRDDKVVSAIHLYQPDTGEWTKVGDLLTPRYDCTCAMITDTEVLVAGGSEDHAYCLKDTDITLINAL